MKNIFTLALGMFFLQSVISQPLIPDSSFGNNGRIFHNLSFNNPASVEASVMQPDGKMVVGGYLQTNQMSFYISRWLSSGKLDSSFGTNGKTVFADLNFPATAINVTADGKIIASGYNYNDSGSYVVRLLANGAIDNSFNGNGRVILKTTHQRLSVNALAAQPDGKIIVGGISTDTFYVQSMYVARINVNGSADNSFFGTGSRVIAIGNSSWVNDLAIQTDGKILLCGVISTSTNDLTVTRLNTNGTTDISFSNNGYYSFIYSGYDDGRSIDLQPDGKIVVGGIANGYNMIARLNTNGTEDQTFGTLGVYFGSDQNSSVTDVHVRTDGKIAATCSGDYNALWYVSIIQLSSSGVPDASFDGDGTLYLYKQANNYYYLIGSVVQNDGKVIVSGINQSKGFFTRINITGAVDATYGNNGNVDLNIGESTEWINTIALQPDGKVLSLGYAGYGNGGEIIRYNSNGSIDQSFGTGGKIPVVEFFNCNHLFVQQDGKIIASGSLTDTVHGSYYSYPAIFRFNSNGAIDSSFNGTGYMRIYNYVPSVFTSSYDNAFLKSIMLPNGKIVAAGTTVIDTPGYNNKRLTIARINSNGSIDSTFGVNGKVTINISPRYEEFSDLKLQQDGKVVILAQSYNTDSTSKPAIVRLKANGDLDNSFNNLGYKYVSVHPTLKENWLARLAVLNDGRILAAGMSNNADYDTVFLTSVKLKADGSFDSSYNGTGKVFMPSQNLEPNGAIYDSAGNVFFAGYLSGWNQYGSDTLFIGCIKSNGTIDSTLSFSPDDKFIDAPQQSRFEVYDMAILPNGSILLAGGGGLNEADADYALAVYKRTPNIPLTICPGAGTSLNANFTGSNYQWQMNTGSGFINIPAGVNYSGINNSTLQLLNMPSSNYGMMFRCVADGKSSSIYQLQFANAWTGSVSTAWENASNWNCGSIPDANTDVVITTGNIIVNSNVVIRTLTLSSGVNLTVQPGFTLTVLK